MQPFRRRIRVSLQGRWYDDESTITVVQLYPEEEAAMRRDNDYLRDLLREMVEDDDYLHALGGALEDDEKREYHLDLLVDAGLLQESNSGVYRVTNYGQDFYALTLKSDVWEKAKNAAAAVGGGTLQVLFSVAEGYVKQKLVELGVPLS